MTTNELVGSLGVLLLLLAFVLNATGRLTATSRRYHAMNAIGAALACAASWMIDFVPFVVLEGSWCLAALVALGTAQNRTRLAETT